MVVFSDWCVISLCIYCEILQLIRIDTHNCTCVQSAPRAEWRSGEAGRGLALLRGAPSGRDGERLDLRARRTAWRDYGSIPRRRRAGRNYHIGINAHLYYFSIFSLLGVVFMSGSTQLTHNSPQAAWRAPPWLSYLARVFPCLWEVTAHEHVLLSLCYMKYVHIYHQSGVNKVPLAVPIYLQDAFESTDTLHGIVYHITVIYIVPVMHSNHAEAVHTERLPDKPSGCVGAQRPRGLLTWRDRSSRAIRVLCHMLDA